MCQCAGNATDKDWTSNRTAEMNQHELVFILNDTEIHTSISPGTSLVDFIRRDRHLTGTRIGCREGDCGACTVLIGTLDRDRMCYRAAASCLMPVAAAAGCHVVTIEGLNNEDLTPVQRAFVEEGASQCGFCTPGLVVSLTGFLLSSGKLDEEDALTAIEATSAAVPAILPFEERFPQCWRNSVPECPEGESDWSL